MAKTKKLTEAAADVLAASIARTRPGADSFGLGKSLNPGGVLMGKQDLGAPVQRSDQQFPDFTKGTPRATPPGATPPVGAEPMHHLKTQPQDHEGDGDNKDPTGSTSYNMATYRDRVSNVTHQVSPGQGNKNPPWAHESVEALADRVIAELAEPTLSEEDKEKKKGKFDFFKKDDKFGKMKEKMKEKGSTCEGIEDDDLVTILAGLYEEPVPTTSERLAAIVAEAITESQASTKTDLEAIFEGETLSEDFKSKASTIFEAAVGAQVTVISKKLEEAATALVEEAAEQIQEEIANVVDGYLNYMVSEWISENEVAVERGLRAEIVEGFIAGLRTLFTEHYIDIPDDKVDMVEELANKNAELEEQLESEINKNIGFKKEMDSLNKVRVVDSVCEGLSDTQKAKIVSLTEATAYGKDFADKVKTLRENYFPGTKIVVPGHDALNIDQMIIEGETNQQTKSGDPFIDMISQTISRTTKR